MSALIDLLDIPKGGFVLVTGLPGAGKTTFTCKSELYQLLDKDQYCVSVVTEQPVASSKRYLGQLDRRFAERNVERSLIFVDAYRRTVGLKGEGGLEASCGEPTSISLAIADGLKQCDHADVLITLDSLTPVYVLGGGITVRFVQTVLTRYAAEGFRVLATIDEGVAKSEDLTAMMSMAVGILRMRKEADQSVIEVLKHPTVKTTINIFPLGEEVWPRRCRLELTEGPKAYQTHYTDALKKSARSRLPDFVHILWLQLAFWGGMLWDPKRFPSLVYEIVRDTSVHCGQVKMKINPWYVKLLMSILRRFVVRDLCDPTDMSRLVGFFQPEFRKSGSSLGEYLKQKSKRGEHHLKQMEYAVSWAFPNVGKKVCVPLAAGMAGGLTAFDRGRAEWNVYETQCVGMGAEHCELVAVTGRPAELEEYIAGMEYSDIERAVRLLMARSVTLAVEGKEQMMRPHLGTDVRLEAFQDLTSVPALSNERYMVAMRLSGVHTGRWFAQELLSHGVVQQDAPRYLVSFLQAVKAGEVMRGDPIRIQDCAEAAGIRIGEHLCFYTTGFLTGFHEVVGNRKVTKIGCIGAGDSVCEWSYS